MEPVSTQDHIARMQAQLQEGLDRATNLRKSLDMLPQRAIYAYTEELRPLEFGDVVHVLHAYSIMKLQCRLCIRFRRCLHGYKYAFYCVTYLRWHQREDERALVLKNTPITEEFLLTLTHVELLGVMYYHNMSLATVVDFSKVGLRARILAADWIESSEYLLT